MLGTDIQWSRHPFDRAVINEPLQIALGFSDMFYDTTTVVYRLSHLSQDFYVDFPYSGRDGSVAYTKDGVEKIASVEIGGVLSISSLAKGLSKRKEFQGFMKKANWEINDLAVIAASGIKSFNETFHLKSYPNVTYEINIEP